MSIAYFIEVPFRGQGRTHLHWSRGTACFDEVCAAGTETAPLGTSYRVTLTQERPHTRDLCSERTRKPTYYDAKRRAISTCRYNVNFIVRHRSRSPTLHAACVYIRPVGQRQCYYKRTLDAR